MKIAFVGHAAVGKDTLSDYVSIKLGLTNVSSGNLIREYIRTHNLGSIERDNMRIIGNTLRQEKGGDYLVHLALDTHPDNLIISGLRTIDEIKTFKEKGGVVIALIASAERRYELAQMRNRIDDTVTFSEWLHAEEKEYSSDDPKKQNIQGVIDLADYIIENTGTLDDLYQKCDEVLKQIS